MNELGKRIVFGSLYVGIILAAYYAVYATGHTVYPLWVLYSIFVLLAIPEAARLLDVPAGRLYAVAAVWWAATVYTLPYAMTYLAYHKTPDPAVSLWGVWGIALAVYLWAVAGGKVHPLRFTAALALSVVPFVSALFLDMTIPYAGLFIFITLWLYDSFAYLTGKYFGRHKLAPRISPKKTVEGLVGGAVITFLAWAFLKSLLPHNGQGFAGELGLTTDVLAHYYGLIPVVSWVIIMGTLGDLTESWLKRRAGVKDSGALIPGHGGILDRLDSFMLTATATAFILFLSVLTVKFLSPETAGL